MFTKVAVKITANLERENVIASEDRELYVFGIQQGLTMILNFATMIIVGLVIGVFWHILVFAFAYMPLRSFAGGYHAKTPLRCYVASTAMVVFVAVSARIVIYSSLLMVALPILALVCATVILILAPLGSENKPLDDIELKVYKKKTLYVCAIEITILFVLLVLGIQFVALGIQFALIATFMLIAVEKVRFLGN